MKPLESRHRVLTCIAIVLALPLLTGADGKGGRAGGTIPIGSGETADGGDDAAGSCAPADCAGLPVFELAKTCSDGTALSATVCTRQASGHCGWGFPPCPGTTDASAASCNLQPSA